jgi:5-methylcytosine-specific restriction endonuclease McrA
MTKRQEFPTKIKLAAWERCDGRCERCTARLGPGNIRFDHINPDAAGGAAVLANAQVLCRSCHDDKTFRRDVPLAAKLKRIRNKHLGIGRRKSWRSFLTNRDGPFRKRMDGTQEKRK